jgi:hypothetical protein
VVPEAEFNRYIPENEHEFFRPAAGTSTIVRGRIEPDEFVFFPYDTNGLRLDTEAELIAAVPEFYRSRLLPNKAALEDRSDKSIRWWELIRPRSWQLSRGQKIVSAYFGTAGHFAFDDRGEFVCLHGYAWTPVNESIQIPVEVADSGDVENVSMPFFISPLPWAYVAVLNSAPFSTLLSCFCPQVQGGQFNLSIRYVTSVPIPNLSSDSIPADLIESLAETGLLMNAGEKVDEHYLSGLVSRAYGISVKLWDVRGR